MFVKYYCSHDKQKQNKTENVSVQEMFQLILMLNILGFFFLFFLKFYNTWLLIFMPYIFGFLSFTSRFFKVFTNITF